MGNPDGLAALLQQPEPVSDEMKVVKTHVFTQATAAVLQQQRAIGVYCYRDLRDMIVSFIHKEQKPFEEAWVKRRITQNLQWYTQWTQQPRMLVSRYEAMIADLPGEVQRIADHLDIEVTPQQCAEVAAHYTLDKQRDTIRRAEDENRLENGPNGMIYDRHLLHTNHIRSGEVGGWREALTPSQVSIIEEHAYDWLTQHGYSLEHYSPRKHDSAYQYCDGGWRLP